MARTIGFEKGREGLHKNRVDAAIRSDKLDAMAAKVAESAAQLKQIQDAPVQETRAARAERGNPFAPAAVEGVEMIESTIAHNGMETLVRRYYRRKAHCPRFSLTPLKPRGARQVTRFCLRSFTFTAEAMCWVMLRNTIR